MRIEIVLALVTVRSFGKRAKLSLVALGSCLQLTNSFLTEFATSQRCGQSGLVALLVRVRCPQALRRLSLLSKWLGYHHVVKLTPLCGKLSTVTLSGH